MAILNACIRRRLEACLHINSYQGWEMPLPGECMRNIQQKYWVPRVKDKAGFEVPPLALSKRHHTVIIRMWYQLNFITVECSMIDLTPFMPTSLFYSDMRKEAGPLEFIDTGWETKSWTLHAFPNLTDPVWTSVLLTLGTAVRGPWDSNPCALAWTPMLILKRKHCSRKALLSFFKVSILEESCQRLEFGKYNALYLPASPWEETARQQLAVDTNHIYNCHYTLPLSVTCLANGQRTLTTKVTL